MAEPDPPHRRGMTQARYDGEWRCRAASGVGLPWAVVLPAVLLWVLLAGSSPAAAADHAWAWPLADQPAVVRGFDPPEVRYAAGHRGADLAGAEGAPVLAAGDGQVGYAGLLAGRGVVVVVHGDLRTTYEPVTAEVTVGAEVTAGQRIGVLGGGHAGCPVTACLHWGLKRGETYLDPVRLVDRGPVRLLPLSGSGAASNGSGAPPVAADQAPVARAAPALPPPAPVPAAQESSWSLRATEAALGAGAVVALVAGLALLVAPRRPPDGPSAAGATGSTAAAGPAHPPPTALEAPVDLSSERARRRTAS